MSSYWDAALRAGRGLHGTAEPRPRARFEDDAVISSEAFQSSELEQGTRMPDENADGNKGEQPQPSDQVPQRDEGQSASPPMVEQVAGTQPNIKSEPVVAQSDRDTQPTDDDGKADDQTSRKAIIPPATEPNPLQAIAIAPLPPEHSEGELRGIEALPLSQPIASAEIKSEPARILAEPMASPFVEMPETQSSAPQLHVVPAQPLIPETARLEVEQHPQPPTLLITIDSIDIRIGAEAVSPAPASRSRRAQPPVVALQDYLARRSEANS